MTSTYEHYLDTNDLISDLYELDSGWNFNDHPKEIPNDLIRFTEEERIIQDFGTEMHDLIRTKLSEKLWWDMTGSLQGGDIGNDYIKPIFKEIGLKPTIKWKKEEN